MLGPMTEFLAARSAPCWVVALLLCSCSEKDESDRVAREPDDPPRLISEEGRSYIWDAEHRSNLLKEIGFSRIAEALQSRNRQRLVDILAPGFKGLHPAAGKGQSFQAGILAVREEVGSSQSRRVEREGITDWILVPYTTLFRSRSGTTPEDPGPGLERSRCLQRVRQDPGESSPSFFSSESRP